MSNDSGAGFLLGGAMSAVRVGLFETFSVTRDGRRVDLPGRSQRLVALLALRGPLARGAVAGMLWPEASEERARASLRAAVCAAQRADPELLRSRPGDVRLTAAVDTDVALFRSVTRASRRPSGHVPSLAWQLLPGGPFAGSLLTGWTEDWVVAEREVLHQLRLYALDAWAAAVAAVGDIAGALELASAAVQADPLRESAHRRVMSIHFADGNVAAALRQYEHFRALLDRALGIPPSHLIQELADRIRTPLSATGA
jgi:DNA-binding SARP family transcriptional activator